MWKVKEYIRKRLNIDSEMYEGYLFVAIIGIIDGKIRKFKSRINRIRKYLIKKMWVIILLAMLEGAAFMLAGLLFEKQSLIITGIMHYAVVFGIGFMIHKILEK